ncbi:P-loop ATPase family protein [Lentzea atacamensis]|uniref:P-loop ATPase family protein n=2 Tax=Lentzea atacamensis TaxID=531938 RepID=A0ABX9DWA0_9PSEU|nr:P-loop ATPase family protein [Lentzea atacamensis]
MIVTIVPSIPLFQPECWAWGEDASGGPSLSAATHRDEGRAELFEVLQADLSQGLSHMTTLPETPNAGQSHSASATSAARQVHLRVISCGTGHGPAPQADVTVNVAAWFRDPHVSPTMRSMTGCDTEVVHNVLRTPGAAGFIDRLFKLVTVLVELGVGTVTVVVQCIGGRHRSVVISDQLVLRALSVGWVARVHHRDIDKPVLTSRRNRAVRPV